MSIEKEWEGRTPVFIPTCDICGSTLIPQYYFHDAVESKRLHGWKSRKINGEWVDICDDCLSAERKNNNDTPY